MARTWYVGTRYHFNDTYATMIRRGAAETRIHPATVDGTEKGEPVLMTREVLAQKRREMGIYTFGAQMLLDPKGDKSQGFKYEWLRYYEGAQDGGGMNIYMLVDPASEKKKASDYSSFMVIGLAADENYYILDMVRDRLNLTERADCLFALQRRWRSKRVGYEKYGLQADVQHMQDRMKRENYRFEIVELGGQTPKPDRIKRLVPSYEQGRWYLPTTCYKTDYEGISRDLVQAYIHEEFLAFPVAHHDDMLDAQSRIFDEDMDVIFPEAPSDKKDRYARAKDARPAGSWMSG